MLPHLPPPPRQAKCVKDMVATASKGLQEGARVRVSVLLDNVYGLFRVAEMVSTGGLG